LAAFAGQRMRDDQRAAATTPGRQPDFAPGHRRLSGFGLALADTAEPCVSPRWCAVHRMLRRSAPAFDPSSPWQAPIREFSID
jgi:hypothetical protein